MDSRTIAKGTIVFVLTFGMFVLAKQGASTKPSDPQTTQAAAPVDSPAPSDAQSTEQPTAVASAPATESTEQPTNTTTDSQPTADPYSGVATDVKDVLTKWINAIVSNDAQLQSSCYAPTMTNYFDQSNVDNAVVQASKRLFIDQGNRVISFHLEQISVEAATPSSATLHLVKDVTWQNASGVQIQKQISSRLTLQSFSDGWKITSEQNQQ
jgi:hypothetical protein